MNKFDSTPFGPPNLGSAQRHLRLDNTGEGWLIQVYSGDRRLLWVLDPSHAWMFGWGLGFGLLLAVGWFNLASQSPPATYSPAPLPAEMWVD
ncbi:MAG: hypothetical protein VKI82_13795 [Leptolyngbya sp.]|nr:hypothetical protein [Leptolyngbya sp.]